jgi:hypothetical protein
MEARARKFVSDQRERSSLFPLPSSLSSYVTPKPAFFLLMESIKETIKIIGVAKD